MFSIEVGKDGRIVLAGRLDASKVKEAEPVFDAVDEPVTVDLSGLEYVSSLGLGLLVKTQRRLVDAGKPGLILAAPSPYVRDILRYGGFHHVFEIESEID